MSKKKYASYGKKNASAKKSIKEWTDNINKILSKFEVESAEGMVNAINIVGEEALRLTPIETGKLRDSQYRVVSKKGNKIIGTVGYNSGEPLPEGTVVKSALTSTDYAPFVHEIPEYRHNSPTQAKFLTDAFINKTNEVINAIVASLRRVK